MVKTSIATTLIAIGALTLLSTGCATIVRGTTQKVTFDSSPQSADVFVDGALVGQTPLTIEVERSAETTAEIRKEGHEARTFSLGTSSEWGWVIIGNCLTWGTTGTTTDMMTGAHLEYTPNSHYIQLVPARSGRNIPEDKAQHLSMRITHYVLANYVDLSAEISTGGGQFVNGLASLLSQRAATFDSPLIAQLQTLHAMHLPPPRFAERVAAIGL